MADTPLQPPQAQLPFGTVKGSDVFLTTTALRFLQGLFTSAEETELLVSEFSDPAQGLSAISPSAVGFKPTIQGATTAGVQTYSTQFGYMAQIGPLTLVLFSLQLASLGGTAAGNAVIGNLPFAGSASATGTQGGWLSSFSGVTMAAGYTQLGAQISAGGQKVLNIFESGSGVARANLPVTSLSGTAILTGGVIYFH